MNYIPPKNVPSYLESFVGMHEAVVRGGTAALQEGFMLRVELLRDRGHERRARIHNLRVTGASIRR